MTNKKKTSKKSKSLPLVSLCTPTFNRRPFIQFMIKCFQHQTYPKDRIEWIIIDDGTDPIEDLVKDIPQVKYFYYEEKMELGKKRNLMHTKSTGDIIIYMDDDDYYPPERVSHAVEMLQNNPKCLVAGSSEMHIYFESKNTVYQCGPYGPNHATAATFAFKRELLTKTKYNEDAACAEESGFLKGYSFQMVQLDTQKTILVCSHKHNSLNKEKLLLENPHQTRTVLSRFTIDDFIKEPDLKQFYMHDMNTLLESYEPGKPENKPKVLEHLKKLETERAKREEMLILQNNLKTAFRENNVQNVTMPELEKICMSYEQKLQENNLLINELFKKVKLLTEENKNLKYYICKANDTDNDTTV